MHNNNILAGSEKYVPLFDGGDAECSLSATVIDNGIIYIVEDDGKIEEHSEFSIALEEYIRTAFVKKNGVASAISSEELLSPCGNIDSGEALRLIEFIREIEAAVVVYGAEHIDVVSENGIVYGIYHSKLNSFGISKKYPIGIMTVEGMVDYCNGLNVGYIEN